MPTFGSGAQATVEPIRRHGDRENRRRPVIVVGKIPDVEDDTIGTAAARASVN
jgi:hypothetical protein